MESDQEDERYETQILLKSELSNYYHTKVVAKEGCASSLDDEELTDGSSTQDNMRPNSIAVNVPIEVLLTGGQGSISSPGTPTSNPSSTLGLPTVSGTSTTMLPQVDLTDSSSLLYAASSQPSGTPLKRARSQSSEKTDNPRRSFKRGTGGGGSSSSSKSLSGSSPTNTPNIQSFNKNDSLSSDQVSQGHLVGAVLNHFSREGSQHGAGMSRTRRHSSMSHALTNHSAPSHAPPTNHISHTSTNHLSHQQPGGSASSTPAGHPPAPNINLIPVAPSSPLPQVEDEKSDVKQLTGVAAVQAPHVLGNSLNPSSTMAQKMCDTLSQDMVAHSVFTSESPPANHRIGPQIPGQPGSNVTGPTNNHNASGSWGGNNSTTFTPVQSLEQLLEHRWEQGPQFLMEQAQHFDIASLLTCLHQLRAENNSLEEQVTQLIQRRDHLLAVNARVAIPLVSPGGNGRTQSSSRKRMSVPDSDNSDSSDFIVRQIQDAKEEGDNMRPNSIAVNVPIEVLLTGGQGSISSPGTPTSNPSSTLGLPTVSGTSTTMLPQVDLTDSSSLLYAASSQPSGTPLKRARSQSSEKTDNPRRSFKRGTGGGGSSSSSKSLSGSSPTNTPNIQSFNKNDSLSSDQVSQGHLVGAVLNHFSREGSQHGAGMSRTRRHSSMSHALTNHSAPSHAPPTNHISHTSTNHLSHQQPGGSASSTPAGHPPAPNINLIPVAPSSPLPQVEDEKSDVKQLTGVAAVQAPHVLGNSLNPSSTMAQKMCDTLSQDMVAHSVFTSESPPANHRIGPQIPGQPGSNVTGPTNASCATTDSIVESLEQLLERQWEQGSQFLMEQAQHFDIASLLTCLHQLRAENNSLEEQVTQLIQRRDHLLAVNARVAIPLVSPGGNGRTQASSRKRMSVPDSDNSDSSNIFVRQIQDAKEEGDNMRPNSIAVNVPIEVLLTGGQGSISSPGTPTSNPSSTLGLPTVSGTSTTMLPQVDLTDSSSLLYAASSQPSGTPLKRARSQSSEKTDNPRRSFKRGTGGGGSSSSSKSLSGSSPTNTPNIQSFNKNDSLSSDQVSQGHLVGAVLNHFSREGSQHGAGMSRTRRHSSMSHALTNHSAPSHAPPTNHISHTSTNHLSHQQPGGSASSTPAGHPPAPNINLIPVAPSSPLPQVEDEKSDVKQLTGVAAVQAPHVLGNSLNPSSTMAQKMCDTLSQDMVAHSVFTSESPPANHRIGPQIPGQPGSNVTGPTNASCATTDSIVESLEQLLERQWEQGSQFLMEQAQHFDIASLQTCLHQLRAENNSLEEQVTQSIQRRDHLLAVNARVAIPLVSPGGNGRTQASSRKRMSVPDSDNSDSSNIFVRQIQDAKEEGDNMRPNSIAVNVPIEVLRTGGQGSISSPGTPTSNPSSTLGLLTVSGTSTTMLPQVDLTDSSSLLYAASSQPSGTPLKRASKNDSLSSDQVSQGHLVGAVLNHFSREGSQHGAGMSRTRRHSSMSHALTNHSAPSHAPPTNHISHTSTNHLSHQQPGGSASSTPAGHPPAPNINLIPVAPSSPLPQVEDEKSDVKQLTGVAAVQAPHVLGNSLNPSSTMAQKMCDTLSQDMVAHSVFTSESPPANHRIGPQIPGQPGSNVTGPTNASCATTDSIVESLEQLLERQWEQGSQFLMEQAQHFDIASLQTCLHQLRAENNSLEEQVTQSIQRRDHLLAVNARVAIPLVSPAMNYAAVEETLPKYEESETKEEVSSIHEDHQSDGCGLEDQTRAGREHNDEENDGILNPTMLFKEFAEHTSHYSKYFLYMMDYKKRQQQRMKELMRVFSDLMKLKEENMSLMSAFLKKTEARLRESDDITRHDSLLAISAVLPCILNGASDAIATMVQYFKIRFKESEELENLTLILTAFSRLNSLVTDSPVAEDNFYASFLIEWKNRSQLTTNRSLADFGFKGILNVCKTTVEKLIEVIGPRMPQKYGSRVLSIERQAIIGLWYMVHTETCEQMSIRFSVRPAAVTSIIHSFVTNVIEYGHFIRWPTTEEDVTKVVTDFEMMKKDAFPGVIGALGCKYLTFKCPVTPWAKYLMESRPKDVLYRLAVQGISDCHHVFTNLFVSWLELSDEPVLDDDYYERPESTKMQVIDVFTRSSTRYVLAKLSETGLNRLHVLADSTYPLLPTVMVPYGGELDEDSPEKLFNLYLQLTRSVVDVAFGKVMNRFKRLASMDLEAIQFIKAAFGIHNLCMRLGDDFEPKKIKLPEIRFEQAPTRGKELSLANEKRQKLCEGFIKRDNSYVYRKAEAVQDGVADAEILKKE